MVSGLFFGFAFGMGGLGAAVLGKLADHTGIEAVYRICAYLPAIGLLTWFLPPHSAPAATRPRVAHRRARFHRTPQKSPGYSRTRGRHGSR